ncbi:PREDICTED: uncharacterized protein LOC104824781 [Tarenaya hassleriana]|uniref:uncharacterized protein LOC104824781 n=1 Tax=Tarenaya hassleriana TaxID=28532 RepID=UPI00053C79AE|nr:PREDICTED: uncharacterized protein LOC104824781 [Tarenaya hassleriana]
MHHYYGCCCRGCRPAASPVPVAVMIAVALVLLGLSSVVKFEVEVATAEERLSWILLAAVPVVLLLAVRWLSYRDSCKPSFYLCPCGRWKCGCYYR